MTLEWQNYLCKSANLLFEESMHESWGDMLGGMIEKLDLKIFLRRSYG